MNFHFFPGKSDMIIIYKKQLIYMIRVYLFRLKFNIISQVWLDTLSYDL